MKPCFIKLAIIVNSIIYINCYILSMSIADKSYNIKKNPLFADSYLDLKKPIKISSADTRICEICKVNINIKREIPYNCTIPLGCPFNRNTKKIIKDSFKG
jgi:hypothetical protein